MTGTAQRRRGSDRRRWSGANPVEATTTQLWRCTTATTGVALGAPNVATYTLTSSDLTRCLRVWERARGAGGLPGVYGTTAIGPVKGGAARLQRRPRDHARLQRLKAKTKVKHARR